MLYIDVTVISEQYKFNLGGIPRVEQKIIEYYLNRYGDKVSFIKFLKSRSRFVGLSRQEVRNLLLDIEAVRQAPPQTSSDLSGIRRLIIRSLERLGCHQQAIQLREGLFKMMRRVRQILPTVRGSYLTFEPAAEDLVFILSGKWSDYNYTNCLVALCHKTDVNILVHDLIPIICPAWGFNPQVNLSFEHYMKSVLPHCSRVISTSKNSAHDIRAQLKSWRAKVPVVDAFKLVGDISTTNSLKPEILEHDQYIISVSNIANRKNHQLLLYTYRLAQERSIKLPHLYIVGKAMPHLKDFGGVISMVEDDPILSQAISFSGKVSEQELIYFYQNCLMTICPSFYEGWGLPLAESLKFGKVCLAARTSSLPEVGGKLADYFSPNSPEQLLDLIIKYSDPKTRSSRQDYIAKHYRATTWGDSLNRLAQVVKPK